MPKQGSYAKGLAKREEILATALTLIAERGYNAATIRELADNVGLSKTGLLHHFGTKEELFAAVLEQRDALDTTALAAVADPREILPALLHHNATVGGLIELYTRLLAESTPASHVTHQYFVDRFNFVTSQAAGWLSQLQTEGMITREVDAETLAVLLHAVMNGLQVNWLFDESLNMESAMRALFALLVPHASGAAVASEQVDASATR